MMASVTVLPCTPLKCGSCCSGSWRELDSSVWIFHDNEDSGERKKKLQSPPICGTTCYICYNRLTFRRTERLFCRPITHLCRSCKTGVGISPGELMSSLSSPNARFSGTTSSTGHVGVKFFMYGLCLKFFFFFFKLVKGSNHLFFMWNNNKKKKK